MTACSDGSNVTAPAPLAGDEVACGGGTVRLAVLQSTTIDCSSGNLMTLEGGGASYLIVPQFAATDVANTPTSFVIGMSNAITAARPATRFISPSGVSADVVRAQRPAGRMQARFDLGLRRAERTAITSGRWRIPPSVRAASRQAPTRASAPPPALNSERVFNILASSDPGNPVFRSIDARLGYTGDNILVYVDTTSTGVTSADLTRIGEIFDRTLYPLDVTTFGPPVDIDGNGRVIMLMSPAVNALTTASACASQGYVAGFFDGTDLADTTSTESNRGEIFYTIVPDPTGSVSCAHSVSDFLDQIPSIFLHELQHLINFSQKVVLRGGDPEEGWLDEGLSRIAEELGSIHYESLYPPPAGRTNTNQLFPDSAEGYIVGVLYDSYQYLLDPTAETVTLHDDSEDGFAWRGGDWLLLRWYGDQYGTQLYQRLEQTSLTGEANLSAASGTSLATAFGEFSLALFADSLPGQPRTAVPAPDRFASRNLRRLYQALYNVAGPSTGVPLPFPIPAVSLGVGVFGQGSMPPGTMSFATLSTPADSATIHIRFATPAGGMLSPQLRPQVSILRLPG
jgi:hypothetical protein